MVTIEPEVLVCLGATASQALLGSDFRVTKQRGKFVSSPLAPHVLATVHPSSVLRAPGDEARHRHHSEFACHKPGLRFRGFSVARGALSFTGKFVPGLSNGIVRDWP